MTKCATTMRELPYKAWMLDNSVGVRGGRAQHRTWRPVDGGRPVYTRYSGENLVREGPTLYTLCGREVYLNAPTSAARCGVCFRRC